MKLTKEEFRQYIISEVKKIALEEGWLSEDLSQEEVNTVTSVMEESKEEVLNISENEVSDNEFLQESFDTVSDIETTPNEVKKLNEEFKRWKTLVDFRSPLLNKD